MKKLFKFIGIILLFFVLAIVFFYFINNEPLPKGKEGKEADALAIKVINSLHHEAFENTEVIEWSFRGKHFYKWMKREGYVIIEWDNYIVHLFPNQPQKNILFNKEKVKIKNPDPKIFQQAHSFFNNDSFWLVAPYKIFDEGTKRSIVKHNNKDALLINYTSGGSTPGDSYLWILDDNYLPISYKMWTSIIPIGGVSATWSDWKKTEAGILLPTKHKLSLFGVELNMGKVKAYNYKANILAKKVLKAINHKAYIKTKKLEWSFAGKRHYKWNKEQHNVYVSWDTIQVNLYPNKLNKSTVSYNDVLQKNPNFKIIQKANDLFNNDSFWLIAPHKLFEDGIIRTIKKINSKDALLVKYTTGGTTPGDSYLWILDSNYVPKSYKMYVPSMKMNGVDATWDNWITTNSGTLLPTSHTFGKNRILSMGNVKGTN